MVRFGLDVEVLAVFQHVQPVALVVKVAVRLLADYLNSFLEVGLL